MAFTAAQRRARRRRLAIWRVTSLPVAWAAVRLAAALHPDREQVHAGIPLGAAMREAVGDYIATGGTLRATLATAKFWHEHNPPPPSDSSVDEAGQ